MEKSIDKHTGEEFIKKRVNQVFSKAKNRIAFYNKKANELRKSVAYINKPLHTNLRILNNLMELKNEDIFHRQFLEGKGFSFKVHTHYTKLNEKNHIAIYQYLIISESNEQIKIIKK